MDGSAAEEQFRRLFDDYYASVLRYFVRRIGYTDAADAADEVFLVAWRRLDRVPASGDALPWLYAVARRVLANHERSHRRRTRLNAKLQIQPRRRAASTGGAVEALLDVEHVREALEALSSRDREILQLSAWDGLSHAAISAVLGCSESGVGVRLHRARRRLLKAVDASGHRRVNRAAHAAEGDEPW